MKKLIIVISFLFVSGCSMNYVNVDNSRVNRLGEVVKSDGCYTKVKMTDAGLVTITQCGVKPQNVTQ